MIIGLASLPTSKLSTSLELKSHWLFYCSGKNIKKTIRFVVTTLPENFNGGIHHRFERLLNLKG
jgi:hypothetical protein